MMRSPLDSGMTPQLDGACPHCGRVNDAVSAVTGSSDSLPRAGDVSICSGCIEVSVFNADGTLRKPTPAEQAVFDKDDRISVLRGAMQALMLNR